MHLVRHIRVVGPFRFDLLGLGLQFREPRLLLGSARDWHAVNLAQAVGNTRSEEHTSELQSLMRISYAVFCLKKKTTTNEQSQKYMIKQSIHSAHLVTHL